VRSARIVNFFFYGGLLVVMAAILLQLLAGLLPTDLGRSVGINSEGYTLALIIAAWIQFARPRLVRSRQQWSLTLGAAVLSAAIGAALLASDLPSRFRTLNEAFLAVGLAVVYLQLRRPLPRWLPFVLSGALLAVIVLFGGTPLLTDVAETLGVLLLLPLAVDVFDRRLLERDPPTSPVLAYALYAALAVLMVALTLLDSAGLGGDLGATIHYVHRMQESFVCLLLVLVYFAVRRALAPSVGDGRRVDDGDERPVGTRQR
jgi:hypothetical protein